MFTFKKLENIFTTIITFGKLLKCFLTKFLQPKNRDNNSTYLKGGFEF